MLRKLCICSMLLMLSHPAWALYSWSSEAGWSKDWEDVAVTDMHQYNKASSSLDNKHYKKAAAQFASLIKHYPDSKLLEKGLFYQAVAQLKNENYWESFASFQEYIKRYPNSSKAKEAFAHQFDIAKAYQGGAKRPLPFTSWNIIPAKEDAITIYEKIIKEDPFGAFGARAQFDIARVHEDLGAYESAIDSYNTTIDRYGDTQWATKARYRKSIVFQAMNKGADYNEKTLHQAVENLTLYETSLNNKEERTEIRKTIEGINQKNIKRLMGTARYYERRDKYVSAVFYYRKIIEAYSESDASSKAQKRIDRIEAMK